MQHWQERRIHHQRLRVADELGYHDPAQRLQETAQLPHAAVEGGRVQPRHPREEVDEEPRRVPEEGPLALHAAQLLEEGEREDLRVREPLERGVAISPRVEEAIGVVDEAEQHGLTASSKRAAGGVGFGWAISCSLWRGVGWPLFYSQTTQHSSSGSQLSESRRSTSESASGSTGASLSLPEAA